MFIWGKNYKLKKSKLVLIKQPKNIFSNKALNKKTNNIKISHYNNPITRHLKNYSFNNNNH